MTGKRKTPIVPTYKGKLVQALMSVEKGEETAGTWTDPWWFRRFGFYICWPSAAPTVSASGFISYKLGTGWP